MKRIGIIGVGGIANGKHITDLLKLDGVKITAICDVKESALQKTAERLLPERVLTFTDYRALIDSPEVDAVEICTPNHKHVEIARYAVAKGKPVNIEKPLGITVEECETLHKEMSEKGILGMMCFSYRFMPAVRYAKALVDRGALGEIVEIHVSYLKSSAFWEGRRLDWRFVKEYAGTGVLGDLGVHLIDMATLLVGDVTSVMAQRGTVVKRRKREDSEEWADVETDDYCHFIASLSDRKSGAAVPAIFGITRCAIGHANTIRYDVFGTKGSISFDLNDPKVIGISKGETVMKTEMETVEVPKEYYLMQEEAFRDALEGKYCDFFPSVEDGVKCQRVLDALLRSAEEGRIVSLR